MWKKGSILLLALMLLLVGCSSEASLVRDSIAASLEKPNYDYHGTLKLTGDIEKLPQALGEEENKEFAAFAAALKAGLTVSGSQKDLQNTKLVLSVSDDKLLREKGLWTGEKNASVELLLNDDRLYIKTPLDQKHLLVDTQMQQPFPTASGMSETSAIDPVKWKDFHDKMNKLVLDFMKKYIATYGYKLSDAKNLGTETVALPNGQSVKATHVTMELDLKELVDMLLYTAKDATTNADVKTFAVDFMVLTQSLSEEMDPAVKKTTEAEKRAAAEATVTIGLTALKEWLDTEGKKYTSDEIVKMAKAEGLDELKWNLDFYIDENKMPVRQKGTFSVTFHAPKWKEPLTIGLESDQYMYNFGKATAYPIPKADETVTVEQLEKDKEAVSAFHETGFLRKLLELALEEKKARLNKVSAP
jgi:hypothetical protein